MHTDQSPQALAEAVAAEGFDAHDHAVALLVADAERFGVNGILAAIILDRSQPTVARERALGRVVAAYVSALEHRIAPVGEPIGARFTVAA